MDDYKTLVKDATRAVVKDGLGGAVWVHRLADAVESQRSRIEALEAVISEVERTAMVDGNRSAYERIWAIEDLLDSAPSTVLDQMIREAKAEALTEAAARVRALFDMRTTLGKPSDEWLADRAAEYRNGDA